jgi:transcriptional regulator with XRE-family HTH domain
MGVGGLLRAWRRRRRLSQLSLALETGMSARHLSFVETGRSRPSREVVLQLAERLDVPLRERNVLLLAAGYAPAYRRTALEAGEMAPVRDALELILSGHEPFPAVVLDRWWDLVSANRAARAILTEGLGPELLAPPVNLLRVVLHPDGLASRIANLAQYSAHLLDRVHHRPTSPATPSWPRSTTSSVATRGSAPSRPPSWTPPVSCSSPSSFAGARAES